MKLNKTICCLLLGTAFACPAQQINPITRAMLNGYTGLIKENPKDYISLYERGAQYYQLSMYNEALNDLTKALEYTPAKEKGLRLNELSLLADAATEVFNYDLALKSIEEALTLEPGNYANTYKKGNILLHLNRADDAYRTFSSMQSLKSRSQEAYFGMAKARIMQKNYDEARDLMKEAENADPTGAITYCRLGDLYVDMGQPQEAATNYLIAFNLNGDSSRPLGSLVQLAETNYDAVAGALDYAIEKSTNKVPNLFLKGNIAVESGNYGQADVAFEQLLKYPDARVAGVYAQAAKAKLGLNETAAAAELAEKSLAGKANADAYIVKAKSAIAQGNPAEGVINASNAIAIDDTLMDAWLTKAEAQLALNDNKGAIETLNQVVMSAPDNLTGLLMRAYANEAAGNNLKTVTADLNRINLEEPVDFPGIAIKGIAKYKVGKKLDADTIVEKGLENNNGKNDLYWGAVYYAQTGNLEKAKELVDKALFAGYQDYYMLKQGGKPWLNLSPIKHLLK